MSLDFDAVIVGAGFGGMYMLHRLRVKGFWARVFEAGKGVGGTWYWNRYPGARCDVESVQYSYQFSPELQQEWEWTERYATQPEILRYANHVADRFDLRRDIQFETRVTRAAFDETAHAWTVETDRGDDGDRALRHHGDWAACRRPTRRRSPASTISRGRPITPATGRTRASTSPARPVGVIGTGSSAIQSIPIIAQQASHLTVFQRTANYTVPAHNRPLDPDYVQRRQGELSGDAQARQDDAGRHRSQAQHWRRRSRPPRRSGGASTEERWDYGGLGFMASFSDLLLNDESNKTAADFVRDKIHEIVKDPALAETLTPRNIIGCKRLCVDTGYWETFNRPHVTLVDVSDEPIERITADGPARQGPGLRASTAWCWPPASTP